MCSSMLIPAVSLFLRNATDIAKALQLNKVRFFWGGKHVATNNIRCWTKATGFKRINEENLLIAVVSDSIRDSLIDDQRNCILWFISIEFYLFVFEKFAVHFFYRIYLDHKESWRFFFRHPMGSSESMKDDPFLLGLCLFSTGAKCLFWPSKECNGILLQSSFWKIQKHRTKEVIDKHQEMLKPNNHLLIPNVHPPDDDGQNNLGIGTIFHAELEKQLLTKPLQSFWVCNNFAGQNYFKNPWVQFCFKGSLK